MEPDWDTGDGYRRWSRGISQTKFLITPVRPEILAYVSSCNIKYLRLGLPNCEVIRMFCPNVEGIGILEGNPVASVYALAEIAKKPKILVYKFENDQDMLVSELKGCGENQFRAVRFTKSDLLLALTGAPLYAISVWKWAQEQEIMVVPCQGGDLHSDLIVNGVNANFWAEWSKGYITVYEMQDFSNNNVARSEVVLPVNDAPKFYPDARYGDPNAVDILSVVWSFNGELFVLDQSNGLHKVEMEDKNLLFIGTIELDDETDGDIVAIVPFEANVAAILDTGTVLVLSFQEDEVRIRFKLELPSKITHYIPNLCASHPRNSFYALTDVEKKVECVLDGKLRPNYSILDLTLSEIQSVCFIERDAKHVAVVTERGAIYILDSETGCLAARWKMPFFAEVVLCCPVAPILAVGTADGCIMFVDCKNVKTPKIIQKSFLLEDIEIDKLCFTCRGRYLLSGDSQRGHLFLSYGYPTMQFHYLDYSHLGAQIVHIVAPANYTDTRIQVLMRDRSTDEVPYQLNNYKMDCENLELVASQLFDAPITSMCFAAFKNLLYCYSCESHRVGMAAFTEDMQAGSMKEPEIMFDCQFDLDINQLRLIGEKLYTFGEDGFAQYHHQPAPRNRILETQEEVQTHFPAYGGIVEGILSMDGTRMITIGRDMSIVHIQMDQVPDTGANWGMLGWGPSHEFLKICHFQMKSFNAYHENHVDRNPEIGENEISARAQHIAEEQRVLARRSQKDVKEVQDGLTKLRNKMKSLLALNDSRDPSEQLPIDEFEVDEEYAELSQVGCEQDKQIAEILIRTIIEERYLWVEKMKDLMWDQFEVKSRRIKGFTYKREISNYPLLPPLESELADMEVIVQERRIEKRLTLFENELPKAKAVAVAKVAQLKKKRRVKKKKKKKSGDTKFLMRGLSLPDGDSDSPGSDPAATGADGQGPPKRNIFEELMSAVTPPDDDDEEEGNEDEDAEEEIETEEEVETGSQPGSKKSSKTAVSRKSSKGLTSGGSGANVGSETRVSVAEPNADQGPPATEENVAEGGPEASLSQKTVVSVGGRRVPRKARKSAEEEEVTVVEVVETDQSEVADYDDDYLDAEEDYPRKKKRRMVMRKLQEDDEEMVLVEESDSSEESDSDIERQNTRLEERQRNAESRLTTEQRDRKQFIKNFYSGSSTYELFEPNPLLYDQLEVSNFSHIRNQLKILSTEIRKLKLHFNEAFDDARAVKAYELGVIQKRNERMREITSYFSINIPADDPEDNLFEHPESVFEVKDNEVPIPKYMTEEEKRLAELARLEEERRRMEQQEDFRERALIVMMDGVLETRREDMLKRDIPKPAFMLTKEQWEWNQEEYAKANEYFKKVEELERLRNEFRKELETELRGLIRSNSETKAQFDARMKHLYEFKVQIETSIRMEETRICRRIRQIMRRHELDKEEDRLVTILRKLQLTMKSTHGLSSQLVARVEACSALFESVAEREKNLERTFRSDLGEVGHFYDVFTKLYKKRPRINMKTDKLTELLELMIKGLEATSLRSFGQENGPTGKMVAEIIYELDEPMQNPIGCPRSTWDRFCRLRREKICCEYRSRLIGTELMTLKAVLDECKEREGEVSRAMAVILTKLAHQKDLKLGHIHNVEFQLVLNQGQVELPSAIVRSDFYNALLLNKHLVQACNLYIRKFGGIKLGALTRSKIQHRNVKQIEWQFKKIQLKEKHLIEKKKDINLLRVTKEVLEFLRHSADFAQMQRRRLDRIHNLQNLAEKFHRRFMGDQMKILRVVERSIQYVIKDSETKEVATEKRNLQVSAVKALCNVQNPEAVLAFQRERMQTIMRTAFIMRRIAKNAEEIYFLETELERLYKKTYPIL